MAIYWPRFARVMASSRPPLDQMTTTTVPTIDRSHHAAKAESKVRAALQSLQPNVFLFQEPLHVGSISRTQVERLQCGEECCNGDYVRWPSHMVRKKLGFGKQTVGGMAGRVANWVDNDFGRRVALKNMGLNSSVEGGPKLWMAGLGDCRGLRCKECCHFESLVALLQP